MASLLISEVDMASCSLKDASRATYVDSNIVELAMYSMTPGCGRIWFSGPANTQCYMFLARLPLGSEGNQQQ